MSATCARERSNSPRPSLSVTLMDDRRIATPLDWYPRLKSASHADRMNYEIMPMGIHWPDIDEDLEHRRDAEGAARALRRRTWRDR